MLFTPRGIPGNPVNHCIIITTKDTNLNGGHTLIIKLMCDYIIYCDYKFIFIYIKQREGWDPP